MKRMISWILLPAILLAACFSAAFFPAEGFPGIPGAAAETAEESAAEIRMLNDLIGYIYQSEMIYGDLQWVLDSFDRFDADKTWENLQIARAILMAARTDISRRGLPEAETTPEDQMELMLRGVDVSFLENAEASFEGEKTLLLNACDSLRAGIMEDVFLRDDWEICVRHAGVLKELMADDIQYLANTADWVLAALNDAGTTERFRGVMESYCPKTRACQADLPGTPEEIEAGTGPLLDRIESLLLEEAKILGARSDRLNRMTEWMEKNDFQAIRDNLTEISGMPLRIFMPDWYREDDIRYYWTENGEILPAPASGTIPERAPDGCRISVAGVTREEVTAYQAELEEAGLPCIGSTDQDGKLSIFYAWGDSSFAVIWEGGNASILMMENPVCFVPGWVLAALYSGTGEAR